MTAGSPRQPENSAQGAVVPASQQLAEAGTEGQRNPPRHRLAAAIAAQGSPLEPGLAAARTLAQTQAQPGNHLPRPLLKSPYIPLSGFPPPSCSVLGIGTVGIRISVENKMPGNGGLAPLHPSPTWKSPTTPPPEITLHTPVNPPLAAS